MTHELRPGVAIWDGENRGQEVLIRFAESAVVGGWG